MMGVLERIKQKSKGQEVIYYQLTQKFQHTKAITELYEKVIFYLPYSPNMNLHKMQNEIRRLFHSDLQLSPKL
jgi:hypothetical protein